MIGRASMGVHEYNIIRLRTCAVLAGGHDQTFANVVTKKKKSMRSQIRVLTSRSHDSRGEFDTVFSPIRTNRFRTPA